LIILTPLGKLMDKEQLKKTGIDACLFKPVRQARLLERLTGIRHSPQSPEAVRFNSAPSAPVLPRELRVLLAEDNIINQKVAVGQLRKMGCTPDVASNGLEALEAVKWTRYDVILMDCQMPWMDGYEATQQIRHIEEAQGRNPAYIIVLTANAMPGDRERCLAASMNDYLRKPVKDSELRAAVDRACAAAGNKPNTNLAPMLVNTHASE
jgi:CheY-like chemotaxis protein